MSENNRFKQVVNLKLQFISIAIDMNCKDNK